MSIRIPRLEPGDELTANGQNAFLQHIENVSTNLDGTNLRKEALGIAHFKWSDGPIRPFVDDISSSGAGYTFNSTTFTRVDNGGPEPAQISSINTIVSKGDVIRIYASVLGGVTTTSGTGRVDDYYNFRLDVTYFDGASSQFVIEGPHFGYSIHGYNITAGRVTSEDRIDWNRHSIYWTIIFDEDDPWRLDEVELQVQVTNAATSIDIEKYNMTVVVEKH